MNRTRVTALSNLLCLWVFLSLSLSACTSGGKLPNANVEQDLATFRVEDVEGDTSTQEAASDLPDRPVLVTFSSLIKDSATEQSVLAGTPFRIYRGGTLISEQRVRTDSKLVWQIPFTVQEGEIRNYEEIIFNIVGESPHNGTRTVRLAVNPTKSGRAAVIDLTDGRRKMPTPIVQAPLELPDGKIERNPRPEFLVDRIDVLTKQPVPQSISVTTGKATEFDFVMNVCLRARRQDTRRISPGREFLLTGFGQREPKLDDTDGGGCVQVTSRFANFQYFSQQRWFERSIRICGRNREVRETCIDHRFWVNPWGEGAAAIYASGVDPEGPRDPNIIDGKITAENLRPPKVVMRGYVLNFTNRAFDLDNDLNMRTRRFYDLILQPEIERFTFDGVKSEPLVTGKFRLDLLLLKTHSDVVGEIPVLPPGQDVQMRADLKCYDRETIFDLPLDPNERADCYARSYLSHISREVIVDNGRIFTNVPILIPDLRYTFSRSLLYIQLAPISGAAEELSGLPKRTFIGTLAPLEDTPNRVLSERLRGAFHMWSEDTTSGRTNLSRYEREILERMVVDIRPGISEENRQVLTTLARNLPRTVSQMVLEDLDEASNRPRQSLDPDGRILEQYTPDTARSSVDRKIVLGAVEEMQYVENVDDILRSIERYRPQIRTNRESITIPRNREEAELPRGVRAYKYVNNLKTPAELGWSQFGDAEFHVLNRSLRDHTPRQNRQSVIDASLVNEPEVREVLDSACEAFYPLPDNPEVAVNEAKAFVEAELKALRESYQLQQNVLCKIQDVLIAQIYGDTEINLSELNRSGGCRDRRPICSPGAVTLRDAPNRVSGISRWMNEYFGPKTEPQLSPRDPNTCANPLPSRDARIAQAVATGNFSLLRTVISPSAKVSQSVLDGLAEEYFRVMNFTLVKREVAARWHPGIRLRETLEDPDKIDVERNPEHRRRFPNLVETVLQDRCKQNPFRYLQMEKTEFVTEILSRIRNTRAGSTNITVSASIGLSFDKSVTHSAGSNRSNSYGSSAGVGAGGKANGSLGISVLGLGAQVQTGGDIDIKNSALVTHSWYLQESLAESRSQASIAAENTARTLNAEEASFSFHANVLSCISIQTASDRGASDRPRPPGLLLCDQNAKQRVINETWYYIYLFFRNPFSALHDASESLIMRPWTAVIRGVELFDTFKELIQSSTSRLELRQGFLASPDEVMSGAYTSFDRTRPIRDLPGLIQTRSIERLVAPGTVVVPR